MPQSLPPTSRIFLLNWSIVVSQCCVSFRCKQAELWPVSKVLLQVETQRWTWLGVAGLPPSGLNNSLPQGVIYLLQDCVCWSSQPAWKLLGEGTDVVVLSVNFLPFLHTQLCPLAASIPGPKEPPTPSALASILPESIAWAREMDGAQLRIWQTLDSDLLAGWCSHTIYTDSELQFLLLQKWRKWEFPSSPGVSSLSSHCSGNGFNSWLRN